MWTFPRARGAPDFAGLNEMRRNGSHGIGQSVVCEGKVGSSLLF